MDKDNFDNTKEHDWWWKYIERPKRRIKSFFLKLFLGKKYLDITAKQIAKEMKRDRGQLMLDTFEVVRMLGWIDIPNDDYYYVIDTRKNGVTLYSCVGGFTPLKGKIATFAYLQLDNLWQLNGHSLEDGMERWSEKKMKEELK